MMDLETLGTRIAARRRELGLSQVALARRARVGRSTLAALESGRMAELGFGKVMMLLSVLGLDLRVTELNRGRPTFEDLKAEAGGAPGLDR